MSAVYEGNWDERGVVGTRIEITKRTVTILWRGAPVLETRYKAVKDGEKIRLVLKENGMRYAPTSPAYATVTALFYEDYKLHFHEDFPISGPSEAILEPTENNRYGFYSIEDDKVLPLLQGSWAEEGGYFTLTFQKNRMTSERETTGIHVLRSRYRNAPEVYKIVNEDAGKEDLLLDFDGETIEQTIPICDAPRPMKLIYHKVGK